MTEHNVGALVVVKPGDEKIVAGIVTERGTSNFLNILVIKKKNCDYIAKKNEINISLQHLHNSNCCDLPSC